jgi:hypothetical protein
MSFHVFSASRSLGTSSSTDFIDAALADGFRFAAAMASASAQAKRLNDEPGAQHAQGLRAVRVVVRRTRDERRGVGTST